MRWRLFLSLFLCLCLLLLFQLLDFFFQPLVITQSQHFFLPTGSNTQTIAHALYKEHYIPSPRLFRLMARIESRGGQLKAGEYIFRSGITAQSILKKIAQGEYITYSITFPEGWTLEKIKTAMAIQVGLKHTLGSISNEAIAKEFHSLHKNPEGLFFPETYVFSWGVSDQDILKWTMKNP
jgi:UPF0755 protein